MPTNNQTLQSYFYIILLLGVSVLAIFIFLPFLSSLILATAFAIMFRPFYRWLRKKLGTGESLSAFLTMLLVLLVIIVPVTLFGAKMVNEAKNLYDNVSSNEKLPQIAESVASFLEEKFGIELAEDQKYIFNLQEYAKPAATWIFQHLGSFVGSIAQFGINSVLAMLTFFFLLRDGSRLRTYLVDLSPLSSEQDNQILDKMKLAINSVIRGALVLAVVQGLVAGIGYTIFNVPNPVLWGGVTAVTALVPGIGTALTMIPMVIFLFATGHPTGQTIGLAIWGLFAVGLVDNFIGPKLYGRGIKVHTLLILIAVLGGIKLFGPLGFIMGPLILSLLFALIDLLPVMFEGTTPTTTNIL